MQDLTQGPIRQHLVRMAVPMAIGMLMQTLYFLVDLYFVGRLGDAALAGVGAAGTLTMVVVALTQVLGVGTVALIAQAVGRKDAADANLVFNQSLAMAAGCFVITALGGYAVAGPYMNSMGADPATAAAGTTYLHWYVPGLALQFALVAMGSALRGTGIVKPTMAVQMITVLLNVVLAPILIAGWGTGRPMGVAGAGLASTIAVAVGVAVLYGYFRRLEKYVRVHPGQWRPRGETWRRILAIGVPAGGEFLLMFVIMAVIYASVRQFGPDAQAGFGIGSRVMQAMFLPAMALAFAIAPVAGQNFGAQLHERVRETFRSALAMSCVLMALLTLVCQWWPRPLVQGFADDPGVIAVGATYLSIISWNFVAAGINFSCSGMFQALGNTVPALVSSGGRLVTFVLPILWLARRPGIELRDFWYVSVASTALQAVTSLLLLRMVMRQKLRSTP
ncbi:MAG: MATE family efflux transporter [Steroidobacteraceae bacterium]